MSDPLNIAVLGAGAWGSALASTMVRAGHNVTLWGRDEKCINEIHTNRQNTKYLGDIELPPTIHATTKLDSAVRDAHFILLVTPTQSTAKMCALLKGKTSGKQDIICCAKGLDQATAKTPAKLVETIHPAKNIGVLSGPSFASDVARGLPTAVTLAFLELPKSVLRAKQLSGKNFRIYASDDVVGVELGGALKNILALAVGAARGLELGASAEAALIARGFSELNRLSITMGARKETLVGLSGLGDLVLTASSTQSRNFSYGIAMGRGENLDNLPLAEGALSAQTAAEFASQLDVEFPVIQTVAKVVAGKISAQQAVGELLSRPLKTENEI